MKSLIHKARVRFRIISILVGQVQARVFVTILYYTLVVPFAGLARFFTGPVAVKDEAPTWLDRPAVSNDLDSAREQG